MKQRCEICKMFDCGNKCKCKCHYGITGKFRQDLEPEDVEQLQKLEQQKSEEQAMEGLRALFG